MKRALGCNVQLLKKLKKNSGKSWKDLSDETENVSESLLSRLQRGKYPFVVKEEHRTAICDLFDVADDELFPFVNAE